MSESWKELLNQIAALHLVAQAAQEYREAQKHLGPEADPVKLDEALRALDSIMGATGNVRQGV